MRSQAAPAKLNLALHLTGKRADGYHLLESLVVFTELADLLSAEHAEALSLEVTGEFASEAGDVENNLVLRAAQLLQAHTGYAGGAAMKLEKRVPVGGGLGGGSADAAAALRVLNNLWQLGLSEAQLMALASQLGADVAVCVAGKPALMRGVGDEVMPLAHPIPPFTAVLAHPRIPLLTAQVYAMVDEIRGGAMAEPPADGWLDAVQVMRNDLQRPAIALSPIVAEMLLTMEMTSPVPLLVRMTGSGACCFALFTDADRAAAYAANLRAQHPGWWVAVTGLR